MITSKNNTFLQTKGKKGIYIADCVFLSRTYKRILHKPKEKIVGSLTTEKETFCKILTFSADLSVDLRVSIVWALKVWAENILGLVHQYRCKAYDVIFKFPQGIQPVLPSSPDTNEWKVVNTQDLTVIEWLHKDCNQTAWDQHCQNNLALLSGNPVILHSNIPK